MRREPLPGRDSTIGTDSSLIDTDFDIGVDDKKVAGEDFDVGC